MTAAMIVLALNWSISSAAQEKNSVPKYVSEKGYWVVESNVKDKKNHTIWFYNNDDQVIYKETVTGVKLNTNSRKTKMKLKNVLETAVIAWERSNKTKYLEDQGLVRF